MARLVVGDAAARLFVHQEPPLGPERYLLQGVQEVGLGDGVAPPPGGQERRLVDEVLEVGPDEARGGGGDLLDVHVA